MPAALVAHGEAGSDIPRFTPVRLLTGSRFDVVPVVLLLLGAVLYLLGAYRLRARGDRWSGWRTASWLAGGLGTIAVATLSGLAGYDDALLSVHMVQHMLLSMVAPVFLAFGAPVTLALRTLPPRGRRVLLAVLHSRPVRVLMFPPVGWALFVGSPFALYFSGWYPAALENDWLHQLMHVHFVLVGCLFFWPLIGLDPVPGRVAHPLRFLLVFAALPFHAILGVSIMDSSRLLAGEYYQALDLAWSNPASDQRVAGGLLWASGDLIGLLMLGAVAVQWMRASEREAVREDRRLDRLEARARRAADPAAEGGSESGPELMPVWWATEERRPDR
jgi:putative membrane protein